MKFLEKNCYWIIPLITILAPIGINKILLQPAFTEIVGEDTDWLTFWGNYLGGVIPALGAFVILYIQRRDNERQNEDNRQTQIRNMRFYQESQRLDKLRNAMADNMMAYNDNDVMHVVNTIVINIREAHILLKNLYDRIMQTDAFVNILLPQDSNSQHLSEYKTIKSKCLSEYSQLLDDIQFLIQIADKDPQAGIMKVKAALKLSTKASRIMYDLCEGFRFKYNMPESELYIYELAIQRKEETLGLLGRMQKVVEEYIITEQSRINSIL